MLNVYLTVDTELWPYSEGWPVTALSPGKTTFDEEIAACFYGKIAIRQFPLASGNTCISSHWMNRLH